MSGVKKRKIHLIDGDFEPPEEKVVSDGDILIKQLHKKQINTKTSLSEQLACTKEFTKSVDFVPFTNYSSGSRTLQDVKFLEKQSEEVDYLQSLGISQHDVSLFLDYKENGMDSLVTKHKLLPFDKIMKTITLVEDRLKERKCKSEKEIQSSSKEISKHELESLAIKPNSIETKLLKFALENKPVSKENLCHPMDDIVDIEHKFMENLNNNNSAIGLRKMQKKIRNLANEVKRISEEPVLECPKVNIKRNKEVVKQSMWDVKEKQQPLPLVCKEKKMYTCKPQNYYTIIDGKIVPLNNQSDAKVTENIESKAHQKKLTIDEIKLLPKFENYNVGEPSKVLYVKNLTHQTSEENLRSLLHNFSSNVVSIKVMQGRMKGQAFIELVDEDCARNALNEINGTIVNNKPMVVQFGKRVKRDQKPLDIG